MLYHNLEVTIVDIHVGGRTIFLIMEQKTMPMPIDPDDLPFIILKMNTLLWKPRGLICDIDVGGAQLIAQRLRPVATKLIAILANRTNVLISAKIIPSSTRSGPSPILAIISTTGKEYSCAYTKIG